MPATFELGGGYTTAPLNGKAEDTGTIDNGVLSNGDVIKLFAWNIVDDERILLIYIESSSDALTPYETGVVVNGTEFTSASQQVNQAAPFNDKYILLLSFHIPSEYNFPTINSTTSVGIL